MDGGSKVRAGGFTVTPTEMTVERPNSTWDSIFDLLLSSGGGFH